MLLRKLLLIVDPNGGCQRTVVEEWQRFRETILSGIPTFQLFLREIKSGALRSIYLLYNTNNRDILSIITVFKIREHTCTLMIAYIC